MADFGRFVRSAYRNLDIATLVRQPVDALIGVSPAAKVELEDHNIVTVLDLAASALFREAALLVAAADNPSSEWALAGRAPRTVVDTAIVELPVEVVAERQIEDLRELTSTTAGRISTALSVSTIRELATWPPFLAARQIFQQLVGQRDSADVWDSGTPAELVPLMGRHPTERVFYQNILLDRFLEAPALPPVAVAYGRRGVAGLPPILEAMSVPLETVGQVDIASTLLRSPGFDRVAVGAIVQFSQSWFTSGLSLGQLLHSLALAPGESTRIAMIDWQRRERGSRTEGTQEADQLTSDLSHNRALNEVVDAVARELQTGSSASQVSGESFGIGKSGGGGGSYGGEGQSYGFGGGYSIGYGSGKSQSSSWGVSAGNRDLRSELSQNIQDLTHQASTMTRSRWATTVQEVSQEEHEQLSTRAVTNYNHMHALTIQYYEVVQIYRVAIDIERITRCIFVPMKIFDFRRYEVITRFRGLLAAGALTAQVRSNLLASANSVVVIPARRSQPWNQGNLSLLNTLFGRTVAFPDSAEVAFPRNIQPWGLMLGRSGDATNTEEFPFDSAVIEFEGAPASTLPISELAAGESSDLGRKYIDFRPIFGTGESAKDFWNIRTISLKRKAGKEDFAGEIFVTFSIYPYGTTGGATQGRGSLPLFMQVRANEILVPICTIIRTTTDEALAQHLEENALYYSQLVWRSLDSTELTLALAAYSIGGRPLMQVIDPTPVTIAGNYMVFRTYATDGAWQEFLDTKNLAVGPVSSTVVPLPTGGVFAEAVLGRSNSAEKLDITRFWNWQDSPIPITAPEISALQAGSRNQNMNLDTGKLSPSVLNIMNPTTLPDPTGMAAALTALAQGTMFRDMSGLAGTIGLAGTGLQEAYKGSSDAQKYAMENFKTAASLIKAGGVSSSKSSTASEDGAKINQGKDMDKRGVPGSSGGSSGGGATGSGATEGAGAAESGGEAGSEGSGDGGGGGGGSWEGSAMEETTSGGASRMERMVNSLILGATKKGGGEGSGIGGAVAGKVAEEVVNLGVKFVDRAIESLATAPELSLEAPGVNSNEFCHALLTDYPNPDRYIRGGLGYIYVYLSRIGAGGVINYTDGFSARLEVSWEDVYLDAAQISAADQRRAGALISVACKRNIGFIWSNYSAVGLAKATARASIKLKSANVVTKVIGGQKETVECEVQVEFSYKESGLINPETRGSSVSFILPLVTDGIGQAMHITVIEDTWTNDQKQFKITRTPFE
jgi:hypothetical protein